MTTIIHEPGSYCPERRDEIVDYVFREMGPGAAEAFESHLASCDGCRGEVASLGETLLTIQDASSPVLDVSASVNGGGTSWNDEWAQLRRRLLFAEIFPSSGTASAPPSRARWWLLRAAALLLTVGLAFTAGYRWKGDQARADRAAPPSLQHPAPPVSGASTGNYFDNLDDFTRDSHNFLRRTRMLLMEFTNLGADSDPQFFRVEAGELLKEVDGYRSVAERMKDKKLNDLLDQIAGIMQAIASVRRSNQMQVVADVKASLDLTGLVALLEILDSSTESDVQRQPNV